MAEETPPPDRDEQTSPDGTAASAGPTPDAAFAKDPEADGPRLEVAAASTEPPDEPEPAPPPPVTAAPARPDRPPKIVKVRRGGGWLGRIAGALFFVLVIAPVMVVAAYRFLPPPATPLMLIRLAEGRGIDYRWRSIDQVSPALVNALVAAEDARFCGHHGFDFEAMKKAMQANERRPGKVRGGSTISQQTAKNVFLWPARSYIRKGFEAYFTVLIEALWGKQRIMEMYMNVAEWGPGIYGAQAASRHYFHVDASALTPAQASRLAAILPSPLKWKPVAPGPYVARRSRRIGGSAAVVREDGGAACAVD